MSKQEMRYSAALSREQAAAALEELAGALRAGTIRVTTGERELVISPRDVVDLELDVSRKSDKGKLRVELSWRELQDADGAIGLRFEAVDGDNNRDDGDGDGDDDDESDDESDEDEAESGPDREESDGDVEEEATASASAGDAAPASEDAPS